MVSEQILRIPRSDSEGGVVLMNVASNGPSSLDLRLLATEGESPYILNREPQRKTLQLQGLMDRLMKYQSTNLMSKNFAPN